ncbi:ABC transporter substrate-binding protein [Microbacterium sp. Root180]|uniref:ABC transporter substrate-binding protein n=1 Tax=Microbacterium sp. Root180 TaxID=1736483 RepID=UPI00138F3DDD|nr:ABC transporter substrate-binding protein [Microbacterium sp. Root180]
MVDELVWNLPTGEPPTIDPPNAATYSGAGVVSNLCDALVTIDENYELGPNLVSWDQVSPTTLVYTLEADATFWDGTPVTVDDIVYSLQRAASPESIVSFAFVNVSSIAATSDTEVTIEFSQPDVMFNPTMAGFPGMVIQQKYAEEAGDAFGTSSAGVMCSGPYEFVSWTPGDSIVLKRNDNYWNKDVPLLAENVTFQFITDSSAAAQALTTGEIDGSYQLDPAAIPALEGSDEGRLFFGPSMESVSMSIARADGPLADIGLREALQRMVDREGIADVVFHGAAAPLYTTLSPNTWPADVTAIYQESYDRWTEERSFDVDAAKELVAASDYDGTPIVLATAAGDETTNKIAQLVQQQAKDAGVTIEIKELQPLEFATVGYDKATRDSLGLDLIIGSSFNMTREPLEPLGFILLPDAYYNYTGFDDPRVTELLTGARQNFDDQERAEMTNEAADIAEESSPTIPLVSTSTVTFLNNALGGAITSFAYLSMPAMGYIGALDE